MQEKWNQFVFDLCEAKKRDVDEDCYHSLIETQLQLLGWAKYKGEICHKPNIPIGNSKYIQPDILVKHDGDDQFVIEVKRPVHTQTERERVQLESYMRQLKLDVGIYIGEHLEVFYDKPKSRDAVSVLSVPLSIDSKQGAKFVERFSKEHFSKDAIVEFCEQRIKEMERQANLNKIKESLVADAQVQIRESLRPYLLEKYGNSFSEDEIQGMLASMAFTASIADGRQHQPEAKPAAAIETRAETSNVIRCRLTRNADAVGEFNTLDHSLTVLKGSRINPSHLDKFSAGNKKKRALQLAEYTELRNGERIVIADVRFESPSGAAMFCVGGSSNGWTRWKDEAGRELNVYRNNQAGSDSLSVAKPLTDARQVQLDFWTRFHQKLQASGKVQTQRTPVGRYWYDVGIGRSGIFISNLCNTQKNFVGVRLYIDSSVYDKYYLKLAARQQEINQALGCEPMWDAHPSAKDKTIALLRPTDLSDSQQVDEALDWMVKQTINFREVFGKEIRDIND